ncbi:cytochrome P450 3A4 [Decorospora gaudefroyi]|uniref:Cytochrome P450 3A4 n=1 Tax=Decorospora gaudefroyi TaxID=184978 RepID=A0A6A5K4P7_9PLEO|nr:cytochrome P450 3A4 [Decorospora gaudefroyi]
MDFNLNTCVFLPTLEAAVSFYLLPNVFPVGNLASYWVVFVLVNTFAVVLYKVILYPFFLSPVRNLPQAKGFIPLLGHGRMLMRRPAGDTQLQAIKDTPNHGLILTRGFFHTDRLILTTPAALADVLVHKSYDFEKPRFARGFLRKFLGDGLLMTEGEEHKHHRKLIAPAFHFRHIKELYPVFWSKSIEFCNAVKAGLGEQPSSAVLEIGHYTTQVTLDIIGLAGLGRDIGSLRNHEDELIKNYEEILEPTTEKVAYFISHLVLSPTVVAMLPWKLNERVRVTTGNIKRICKEFVAERKMNMKQESQASTESRDILSIMIRSNDFSDENLVDQLLTFLAAGHETTSSALTWASYLLSCHPKIQTRLREEIHHRIPDPKALSEPAFDVASLLESMSYLNGVCNETLRLYPTIPVSARVAIRDSTVAGQYIPKGTMLFVIPWAINRNPALWGPNAEEFVPERWIDKETGRATMSGGADSNYAFLTFLHGPRSCIGERFARAEMRALVAAFVGTFEMEMADPGEKVVIGGTITSKPVNGMKLRLKPVEWGS